MNATIFLNLSDEVVIPAAGIWLSLAALGAFLARQPLKLALIDMPPGCYWAYIEQEQAKWLVSRSGDPAQLREHYRGWAGLPAPCRLAVLGRRTLRSARRLVTVAKGMYLVGTLYNFCTLHDSLTTEDGHRQTPAMATGITDRVWSVSDLLHYRVAPPRWEPSRRRGRRSKALQALIDRWCPHHRLA